MKKIRVLIYFTHKESLGHSTRILSIIKALNKFYAGKFSVFVFHGGKIQNYLKIPAGTIWYNIPFPYYSKSDFRQKIYHASGLQVKIRARYMISKAKDINPDIFITEFFPFGRQDCSFELLPVLRYLKSRGVKILASIGYPYIVRNNLKILKPYSKLYDKFLIHTPGKVEYDFLRQSIRNDLLRKAYEQTIKILREKIVYTGYILPFDADCSYSKHFFRNELKSDSRKLVVVSRGGGVIYPKIITSAILAKKYLSDDFYFVISTGPSTSKREWKLYTDLLRKAGTKNIRLFRYIPNFFSLLAESDISINMCGYNTAVQLLKLRKKSILIPSLIDPEMATGYCAEQPSRARLLNKYLGSTVLSYNTLDARLLANNIERKMYKPQKAALRLNDNWFDGSKFVADFLVASGNKKGNLKL